MPPGKRWKSRCRTSSASRGNKRFLGSQRKRGHFIRTRNPRVQPPGKRGEETAFAFRARGSAKNVLRLMLSRNDRRRQRNYLSDGSWASGLAHARGYLRRLGLGHVRRSVDLGYHEHGGHGCVYILFQTQKAPALAKNRNVPDFKPGMALLCDFVSGDRLNYWRFCRPLFSVQRFRLPPWPWFLSFRISHLRTSRASGFGEFGAESGR